MKQRRRQQIRKFFACGKPWNKKWWVWIVIVAIVFIPFIINHAYIVGLDLKEANTAFSASDLLNLYGTILSAVGTVILGYIALKQNDRLLALENTTRQEKEFDFCLQFVAEVSKIFDCEWVLGSTTQMRNGLDVLYAIKSCQICPSILSENLLHHRN